MLNLLVLFTVVVIVDIMAYSFLFSVWALVFIPLPAAMIFLIRVIANKKDAVNIDDESGWILGEGWDIENPDYPVKLDNIKLLDSSTRLGTVTIGASGSGKSLSVALGLIVDRTKRFSEYGWSFFDGKGSKDVYQNAVKAGARIDYFFSISLKGSDSINLLEGSAANVMDMLNRIVVSHSTTTSYYAENQIRALATLVPLLKAIDKPCNLRDLYTALSVEDAGTELLAAARKAGASATEIKLADEYYKQDFDTRLAQCSGMLNKMFPFVAGTYADKLNAYQPDISVEALVKENKTCFFHLPFTETSKSVAIAIIEMFNVQATRRQEEDEGDPYPLLFEDWGDFFHDNFTSFSARCRSAEMPLNFFFQSIGQLREVGKNFETQMDDNIATKIIMRSNGADTKAFAVNMFDTYESVDATQMESTQGKNRQTLSVRAKDRLSKSDISNLDDGEAYIHTVVRSRGRAQNEMYKVRFPYMATKESKVIDWPAAKESPQGEGFGLWSKYMDEEKAEAIRDCAIKAAAEDMELAGD